MDTIIIAKIVFVLGCYLGAILMDLLACVFMLKGFLKLRRMKKKNQSDPWINNWLIVSFASATIGSLLLTFSVLFAHIWSS